MASCMDCVLCMAVERYYRLEVLFVDIFAISNCYLKINFTQCRNIVLRFTIEHLSKLGAHLTMDRHRSLISRFLIIDNLTLTIILSNMS